MRFSIVTPNFNHAAYLEQAVESVLRADHGDLEYIVVDGLSTDGSHDIIDCYRNRISKVIIEPDEGPYFAINKGFAASTGQIMGWINSSDTLLEDSLTIANEIFETFPHILWLTSRVHSFLDSEGRLVEQNKHNGFERDCYLSGAHLIRGRVPSLTFVQQESTFWRRSLWEKAGNRLSTDLRYAADFELWLRFFKQTDLWSISAPLGAFRRHRDQLSACNLAEYVREASEALRRSGIRRKSSIGQIITVALRQHVPRRFRPIAHALRAFRPAPVCQFNSVTERWELSGL
jgi:glycosyltransferase involved in cell wall biosynthesis